MNLAENGTTSNETFTVTLTDSQGHLSASGEGVAGSGTSKLTITGSLSQVNAELATLTDTDGTVGSDTITLSASDSFGNQSAPQTIAVTVKGLQPVLTVPAAQTLQQNNTTTIAGVSLAENGSTSNETFMVTLSDSQGHLSASGEGVAGSGSSKLTITGSLSQVNAELATLTDTDGTVGSDTITLTASDSFGNQATPQTIAVTVTGLQPVLTVSGGQTLQQNNTTAITGVGLAENGSTANETFTVTLSDSQGHLSASGEGVTGSGSTKLTITGSLSQVNGELATLTDTDGTVGSDTITLSASDSFGNQSAPQTIAVTVKGLQPVLTVPGSQTLQQNNTTTIAGVSLAENGSTSNETFTVTLSDSQGHLSASGEGVAGSGTSKLTITGSLSQVNAELATLTDTDGTVGSDTITLSASDSFGNQSAPQTIAVTVKGLQPVLTVPASQTLQQNNTTTISGVGLSESGSTANETFTVTLSDSQGHLSASGEGVAGSGSTKLTITGSLSQVNGELATLTDTDGTVGSDTITLSASDSFGNQSAPQTIAVTVKGLQPVLTVPASQTLQQNNTTTISGVGLSESGSTANETFTVTLSDSQGHLSASGEGVAGSGSTKLTITGSLSEVNDELATLTDNDGTVGPDTITLTAKDSFGNQATQQTIAVTASAPDLTIAINPVGKIDAGQAENGFTISGTVTGADVSVIVSLGFGDLKATVTGNSWSAIEPYDLAAGTFTVVATATDNLGDTAPAIPQHFTVPDTGDDDEDELHPLTLAVPSGTQMVGLNQPMAISEVSLAGPGSTNDETFTVMLTDSRGKLSVSAESGASVSGWGRPA